MDEDDISVLREAPDIYLMSLSVLLRSVLEKRISCIFFFILNSKIQNIYTYMNALFSYI